MGLTVRRHLLTIGAFLAFLLIGCMADEVGGVYMITEHVDTLHAVPGQKADITFNAGGKWTAQASAGWLRLSEQHGEGGRNMLTVYTTESNHTKQVRTAQVIITSDGKSKAIDIVQRGDFAFFDASEYTVDPAGGDINMSFTTNVPKGELYISYVKFGWFSIDTLKEQTRAEEWGGKIKTITVAPNETPETRSSKFILGIYDSRKAFLALDSTRIIQNGILAP